MLSSLESYKRVTVRSGHKTGKSASAAIAALWFFSTFEYARVILTAPTAGQIRRILWRELKIRARQAKIPFPKIPEQPATGITSFDGFREIVGVSTDEAERMQGFSSPNMLYIIDEGSGVSEEIFEAIEGNLAGGAYVLMLGNPTQPAGTFYDAFHNPDSAWHTLHVSSIEAAESTPHIPGLATKEWCDEKLREWGPDDPRYQVRVLGNFADSSEAAIIPLSALLKAQEDWEDTVGVGRLELGVDPARFGDDESAIAVRRGFEILEVVTFTKLDEHGVAAKVMETIARHHRKGEGKPLVKIDTCGTIGPGVASVLRVTNEVDLVQVNGAEPSDMPDKFINMRAQLWFACADWIRAGGTMKKEAKLETDLLAPRYLYDARNRLQVEAKKDIKKRLRHSPDRGDAVVLAAYTPRIKLALPIRGNRISSANKYRWGGMGRGF